MTKFDQLGLFATNETDYGPPLPEFKQRSISLQIDFSKSCATRQVAEIVNKISQDVLLFDEDASIVCHETNRFCNWPEQGFLALDVETTGLDPASNRIIEIALVPFNMPQDVSFSQLFSFDESLPYKITEITGITDKMLEGQPRFAACADTIIETIKKASFIVAYNTKFDKPFLESELARIDKILPDIPWIDPYIFVCELDRYKRGKKLFDAAKRWGVSLENAHRAKDDAEAAGQLMLKMSGKIDCQNLIELIQMQKLLQWKNARNVAELRRANSWSTNR